MTPAFKVVISVLNLNQMVVEVLMYLDLLLFAGDKYKNNSINPEKQHIHKKYNLK